MSPVGAVNFSTVWDLSCKPSRRRSAWWRHPCLVVFSYPKICVLFKIYSLVTRESYDFSRLAHPWQTHRRQPPRMDQLITYFQTVIFFPSPATHWIMHQFIRDGWTIDDLFFMCQIKGVTPLGRHTRPACN